MKDTIFIDFETYLDKEYTLRRITTEAYIRDPRFQVIGFSYAIEGQEPVWVTGSDDHIAEVLHSLPWDRSLAVMHNTRFDGAILGWHYGIHPKALGDTMSMARPLVGAKFSVSLANLAERFEVGQKGHEVQNAVGVRREDFSPEHMFIYGEYCRLDVKLCRALFLKFMEMGFPMGELKLIDITLRMFTRPTLELDLATLNWYKAKLDLEQKDQLIAVARSISREDIATQIMVRAPGASEAVKKILRSDGTFARLLVGCGVEPPVKISPTTGKAAYAFAKTDEQFIALGEHPDARVQTMVAARLGVKSTIEQSRTERLIGIAQRGTFPVPLKYCAAVSHRWGGDDKVNVQNFASRTQNYLKQAIVAPEGYVYIDSDSSQIEARTLSWTAGQQSMVDAFAQGRDVYSEMATVIYGRPINRKRVEIVEGVETHPDEKEGFVGKTAVLGCGYSASGAKFQVMLKTQAKIDMELVTCDSVVRTYRRNVPKIVQLWRLCGDVIQAMASGKSMRIGPNDIIQVEYHKLIMPNGLPIHYHGLHEEVDKKTGKRQWVYMQGKIPTKIYGGKLVENIIQSLARSIVGAQMVRIARRYQPVMMVHDSVGILVREEEHEEAMAYVQHCMRWAPAWAQGLPLNCEAKVGYSYGDMHNQLLEESDG